MIPLRDVIPSRTVPVITVALIVVNALVFLLELSLGERALERFVFTWGLVPAAFAWPAVLTSMFLHGGWAHFLGNMLYLWIFGDNVEDRFGHGRYAAFYVLCGAAAALLQTGLNPDSRVPMIGASGAIAGVLGAYFVMFPRSRVLTLVPIVFFVQLVELPAVLLLGFWFVLQLFSGLGSIGQDANVGGVAFWAHAGGFVAGMAGAYVFRRPERQRVEWWDQLR
jgi:membrane associated rhomboid family serine protease